MVSTADTCLPGPRNKLIDLPKVFFYAATQDCPLLQSLSSAATLTKLHVIADKGACELVRLFAKVLCIKRSCTPAG